MKLNRIWLLSSPRPAKNAGFASYLRRPVVAAIALIAASASQTALAQQPAIPPVGEPPAPSPQEQAAIEEQVKQTYLQQHKDELWKQAVSEVEQERRSAWEQRGRNQIPPSIVARLPGLEATLAGRMSAGISSTDELGLGTSASLKLRMKKNWGLEAAGGIFSFSNVGDAPPANSRLAAPFADIAAFGWLAGNAPKGFNVADHGLLGFGFQLLFPWKSPTIPPVYLSPFLKLGFSFSMGQFPKSKGYVALAFEMRVIYRIGLGASQSSPMEGWALDYLAGPAVGF